jgi:3-hydroxyisobutyrate dehydrogenase-like beta-hydroxyacid dehydrogenase
MDESIVVVGLGNVGLPLSAVIADRGLRVVGVDVKRERCEHASLLVPSVISILHAIEYWLAAFPLLSTILEPAVRVHSRVITAGNNGFYSSSLLTAI